MGTQFVRSLVQDRVGNVTVVSLNSLENAGGFSGAKIWKVESEIGPYCVRRWPRPHPTQERLAFIHNFLFHLEKHGFGITAPPLRSDSGRSWTEFDGHFWEVTKWLPGKPDFWLDTNEIKLANAMSSLARLHQVVRQKNDWQNRAKSPGIGHRIQRLRQIDSSQIRRWQQSIDAGVLQPQSVFTGRIRELCQSIAIDSGQLANRCLLEISKFNSQHNLTPCLRDIWHDHVLFVGNHVTGIIDFGALNVDVSAGDFARLLGSLALDDDRLWEIGSDAVIKILPEIAEQIPMIKAIDFANVVLAGLNWINWLFVEKREFPIHADVLARLEHINQRLKARKPC